MDLNQINKIETEEDFIKFLNQLLNSYNSDVSSCANSTLPDYLGGMVSWIEDMDGFFENINIEKPNNINWKFIAMILSAAKVYE